MADSNDWILKLITGPHQGVEVSLAPGRVVVGNDPDCDIVLHDVLVAARHFALVQENGRMTLEPIEGAVFVGGKRAATPTVVPAFGFVTAGTTHVALGPAHARWPLLSLADVPAIEKEPPAQPEAAAADPSDAEPAPKGPTTDQRRRAWWTAGAGAALLLVWLLLWLTWAAPERAAAIALTPRDRAERVLDAFPEASDVHLETNGSQLVASGYVRSDALQRELSAAFRNDAPEVTLRLWSLPRMVETAKAMLHTRGLSLDVASGPPGVIQVSGVVSSPDAWEKCRQLLLNEIPGLKDIDDRVTRDAPAAARPPPVVAVSTRDAPLSIVALQEIGDGQGWIRLSNGAVLFRGGRTADDIQVKEIRDGRAVLTHNGSDIERSIGSEITVTASRQSAQVAIEPSKPAAEPLAVKENPPPNG